MSCGFCSKVGEDGEAAAAVTGEVGVEEQDARGGDAGTGRWVGARAGGCRWADADVRDSFFQSPRDISSSESMCVRRRFVRERACSGGADAEMDDATSGSDSRDGVGAWRLVPAPVAKDGGEEASTSRR